MKLFKVLFDNNKAVEASQIDFSHRVSAEIVYPNGKSILKWLIIFADTAQESISSANKIAMNMGFKN